MDDATNPEEPVDRAARPRSVPRWAKVGGIALAVLAAAGLGVAVATGSFQEGGLLDTGLGSTDASTEASSSPEIAGRHLPPGSPEHVKETAKPVTEPAALEAAMLEDLQAEFGTAVTGVKIQVSGGGDARIDVETSYAAEPGVAETALAIAEAAAQSEKLVEEYPDATVTAYVWPEGGVTYMTRATAVWTDGALGGPVNTYSDSALQ